jgi:transcriptional regulator with XRE-family HTH domain
MSYVIEDIARQLKAARLRKHFSQRALAEKVGVPQSHISKIENGQVNIKLSSLIEFARVLDLELTLVPRKLVPAVQSIVRGSESQESTGTWPMKKVVRELDRIHVISDELARSHMQMDEFAQIGKLAEQLKASPAVTQRLDEIHLVTKQLKRIQKGTDDVARIQNALKDLQAVRDKLAHHVDVPLAEKPSPAYRLNEDEEQGNG